MTWARITDIVEQVISLDLRTGTRAPLAIGGLAVAAGALLYIRDPRTSTYLPCPIHAVTGLWCPGCGTTRALGDLVRGDLQSALTTNALAVVLVLVGVVVWGVWLRARARGMVFGIRRPPTWLFVASVAVVVAFTILRNIPAGSWLAPAS
ncbi:DUF2752 domain-containing protein [Rhodococcus sp. 1163]|uniref:DUF2752 domain-containing protein n=1 Tax=Rhodococcus sp. 1163 TaxID=1905289 RepID=UPI0009FF8817|nr:DUF2752 domain-containing protein [Rhodococcus sp. 1163]